MNAIEFHECLLALSAKYSYSITSYLRSHKRNAHVGGHKNSRHLLFCAADCVLDDPEEKVAFMSDAKRLNLSFLDEGDHIHLQTP